MPQLHTHSLKLDNKTFPILELPAELRIEIYRYSLLTGLHWVSRGRLPNLHSLRYRFNGQPMLLWERSDDRSIVLCKDYECRQRLIQHDHIVEPVRASDFAFGLFLTSREISHDAIRIFFGETHFVFESRFDLHMFLKTSKHAMFVKSLTFNMRKSYGPHSRQIKARFTTWKLRSACSWGPSVSSSIRELAQVCPALAYMELVDDRRCNSVRDGVDLRTRAYIGWEEVQCIRRMGLQSFSYLIPDKERYEVVAAAGFLVPRVGVVSTSFFDWPLQQQNVLRQAAEAYILEGTAEQLDKNQSCLVK
jgi:hypothetical protein